MIKNFFSLFLSLLIICVCNTAFSKSIKNADLAGTWYSDNASALRKRINNYLNKAETPLIKGEVIAIISPHAGFKYSGETASFSFKAVKNKKIDTVIVVGFSHQMNYDAIAVFNEQGVKTPLGILYTDEELAKELISLDPKISSYSQAFNNENSVELILPFIQVAFDNPKVVLFAIGKQSLDNCKILGEALYEVLKEKKNFLIIASTDMSHYLDKNTAKNIDSTTAELITKMDPESLFLDSIGKNKMCGTAAVTSVMIAAKKLGADKVEILNISDSSKAAGDDSKVVGYLAAAFIKEGKMQELLNKEQKQLLLKLSRDTISLYLNKGETLEVKIDDPTLNEIMGAFVTLHKAGFLRGCIGNIVGNKPLYQGIIDMSIASSTQDSRFSPVTKDELADIHIEISALSPLKKITDPDEIILGTHGVLVRDTFRSGVYLPQVATETGWSKEQFMNSLCASKAGMEPNAWKTGKCDIYIFSAEVFGE